MEIKVLKVRVEEEFLLNDQKFVNEFVSTIQVIKVETAFVQEDNYWSIMIQFQEDVKPQVVAEVILNTDKYQEFSYEEEFLSPDEIAILESLKLWRSEKAKAINIPSYCIASNKELTSVAKYKPIKKEELLHIKGFGKHKIENYGEEILQILEQV